MEIFLWKISGISIELNIELHTDAISEILALQKLS